MPHDASGAILNIILDPIFITVLKPYGLGVEAAAYATIFHISALEEVYKQASRKHNTQIFFCIVQDIIAGTCQR